MLLGEAAATQAHFELPVLFNAVAHFAFGVTGALAGLRRGYDFIGVSMLAMITAGGGGLIRDGLLISRGPALILTDTDLLYVVFVAALLTLAFREQIEKMTRPIAVIDAIGLGAFAVYGVDRSLDAGLSVPAAIISGTLTAVGGGLLLQAGPVLRLRRDRRLLPLPRTAAHGPRDDEPGSARHDRARLHDPDAGDPVQLAHVGALPPAGLASAAKARVAVAKRRGDERAARASPAISGGRAGASGLPAR